ncbi:hypothetical protein ACFL6M_06380 [Candidatus Eisenbacteria bacterium]|uniref:Uncharacterized protein n=1 Tax=Eiseniibacteriota bacterium TaxID=2212470 RepID=A0ABV6YLK4_UNCEI
MSAKTKKTQKQAAPKKVATKKDATKKPADQMTTASAANTSPQPPDDSNEVVVFALRLKRSERDAIHAAAGSGKASSFVRALALAAAQGDTKAIKKIMETVQKA